MIRELTEKFQEHSLNDAPVVQNNTNRHFADNDSGIDSDQKISDMDSDCESEEHPELKSDEAALVAPGTPHRQQGSVIMMEVGEHNSFDAELDHSSEEELEVINCRVGGTGSGLIAATAVASASIANARRSVDSMLGEKRKWAEMDTESSGAEMAEASSPATGRPYNTRSRQSALALFGNSSGGSSDEEEDRNLASATPVQFCKSPPLDAYRPTRLPFSPPPLKVINRDTTVQQASPVDYPAFGLKCSTSTRKRHRTTKAHRIQRPCLDFDKMQQTKTDSPITQWNGELSLYCW